MQTPILSLPFLAAGQAQKHVTLNEALQKLDVVVQIGIESDALTTPPASPSPGARFLVAAAATGAWAGQTGKIATLIDGVWAFFPPQQGWIAYLANRQRCVVFNGVSWAEFAISSNPSRLGIGTAGDASNTLTVRGNASLFEASTADHRLKINRATTNDVASVLFQTGYSGSAEVGLGGVAGFSIKVSPDGTSWLTALSCNANNGRAVCPPGLTLGNSNSNDATFVIANSGQGRPAVLIESGAGGGTATVRIRTNANDVDPGIFIQDASAGQSRVSTLGFLDQNGAQPGRIAYFLNGNNPQAQQLRLSVNSMDLITGTGSGRVGIGTTTPSTPLEVAGAVRVGQSTLSNLPSASSSGAGAIIFVSNESGGACLAFSDGTHWRRVTDRAIVS